MRYRVTAMEDGTPTEFIVTAPTEEEAWDKAVEETDPENIMELTCIGYE